MTYKEPGAYLSVVNKPSVPLTGVQMLPCIIGPGAKTFQTTEAVVRGSTAADELSISKPTSIVKIASYKDGPAAFVATEEYSLTLAEQKGSVTWVASKGPAAGETYYVTYRHDAQDSQFNLNTVFSRDALIDMYGDDLRPYETDTPVNYLSLAGKMLFDNGATAVMVCQVKSVLETPTKTEFQVGLDKLAAADKVWRILPVVVTDDIVAAITQHIITYSSYEERKERSYLGTTPYDGIERISPTAFSGATGVLNVVGGYAAALADKRKIILYPDKATVTFSDGQRRQVDGPIIAAAFAGAEQAQPLSKSRTRMEISGFYSLDGVKMGRTEMNALAQKGVTVLTQAEPGVNIVVRHGMSTDLTSTQSKEISILAIQDYCSKTFRAGCEQYIGKYSISNEVLSMVKGTLEGMVSDLVKNSVIISGTVAMPVQDTEAPDTIDASVRVFVPYPCNYIDIVMYLD